MTFTIKHTRSDRPMVAEYLCPVHGRFTLEVARDSNGDPPAEHRCTYAVEARMFWKFGATADARADMTRCREVAPHAISAPRSCRVRKVEVARGSYQKAELPTWTDTTNLGEGQDLEDWQADRDKVWEAERHKEIKELMS